MALVTPFTPTGALDLPALKKLVNHVIDGGVEFLVALGTTGEAVTLSPEEQDTVIRTILEANNGRKPVLLGCAGSDTTAVAAAMRKQGDRYAVQGFLTASPAYNKPTQEGIYQHYKVLAGASPLPIVLYNVPGRTASNVLPETVVRIAQDCPQIVAVKEASGKLEQGMAILHGLANSRPDFRVLSGDDPLALAGVACGYSGVISVIANSHPAPFSSLIRSALQGDYATARTHQYALLPLYSLLFKEGNPAGVKAALASLGICAAHVRLPLVVASESLRAAIKKAS